MAKVNNMDQSNYREHFDLSDAVLVRKDDMGRFVLRLSIGALMLFHGMDKIIRGTEQIGQLLVNVGVPVFFSFAVFIGEVIGPLMLILGYKVRLGAFFVAVDMIIAILLVHSSQLTQVSEGGGWMIELNALYLLGAIAIMFLGSGRYAISKGRGALD